MEAFGCKLKMKHILSAAASSLVRLLSCVGTLHTVTLLCFFLLFPFLSHLRLHRFRRLFPRSVATVVQRIVCCVVSSFLVSVFAVKPPVPKLVLF